MKFGIVGAEKPRKNSGSHIDASLSRQPLVKGERLVRYEVNAVMTLLFAARAFTTFDAKTLRVQVRPERQQHTPLKHPDNKQTIHVDNACWQPLASRLPPKKFCYG